MTTSVRRGSSCAYVLEEDGRVVSNGEERLSDPTYLNTLSTRVDGRPDPL